MIEPKDRELAADIETTVRAIPGVTALFRTGSIVSKVVDAGAQILGIQDDGAPLIRLERPPEGPRVEVAIGVCATVGAVETSGRVHAAIGALCTDQGFNPAEIRVTVVHIDDTPTKGSSRRANARCDSHGFR